MRVGGRFRMRVQVKTKLSDRSKSFLGEKNRKRRVTDLQEMNNCIRPHPKLSFVHLK